jgi:hypothetical protein
MPESSMKRWNKQFESSYSFADDDGGDDGGGDDGN